MERELNEIKDLIKDVQKRVNKIDDRFINGDVQLSSKCLQNSQDASNRPVIQREFKRLERLVWWVIGVLTSSGVLGAAAYSIDKYVR